MLSGMMGNNTENRPSRVPLSGRRFFSASIAPFSRKRRFRPVLRLLGVEDLFAATPRGFQEALWRGKRPEPRAVAQDGVEPWAATFLNRTFVETDVAYGDGRVTFADLVAVIIPLRGTLQFVGAQADVVPSVRRLIER